MDHILQLTIPVSFKTAQELLPVLLTHDILLNDAFFRFRIQEVLFIHFKHTLQKRMRREKNQVIAITHPRDLMEIISDVVIFLR